MKKIKKFFFENTNIRQTILKNTFWVTFSTIFSKIARSVIIIYVARILGTENYGIYTYLISLIAIFSIFSDVGLTHILTREITKNDEQKKEYVSTILIVKLGFIFLAMLIISTIGPLLSKFNGVTFLIIIMGLSMIFESLKNFFYGIPRSQNKMQIEAGLGITTEIISIIIILIVFFQDPSIKSLALAYMIGNGVSLLITIIFLFKNIIGVLKYFNTKLVLYITKSAWPFAISGFFGIFMTNIDSIIIGIYNDAYTLGIYAAAQKPISLLYSIPGFLSISLFPIINQFIKERKEEKLSTLIKKISLIAVGITLPLVIGGIILASPIINVIYGYQYLGATFTFQLLLLTLLYTFPGQIFSDVLFAENRQKIFIKSSILGGVTNVALDFLLIPIYGIVGSAIATIIALLVVNGIFFIEVRKNHKMNIWKDMRKITFAVIMMAISVFIMKTLMWPLILIISVAIIIYFSILFLLKEKLIQDIKKGFSV